MTADAFERLLDEIAQLRRDVAFLAGQGLEEGIVRLPVAQAARRLETLGAVAETAAVTKQRCVAIGRRVALRDGDGQQFDYSIVFPGDGDPLQGWISADSPLGSALLGAEPGATVMVQAPVGAWPATIVEVE
jgi:transcription elongation factor GreA